MNNFHKIIKSSKAAIDLASIMVGIIIIGLIGGVIAATVFAVIPWSQDNASRSSLDSVSTAQSAYKGLSQGKAYADKNELANPTLPEANGRPLLKSDDKTQIGVNSDKSCFVAVTKSGSGKYFYITNAQSNAKEYTAGSTNLPTCVSLPDLVASLNGDSNPSDGSPDPSKENVTPPTLPFSVDYKGTAVIKNKSLKIDGVTTSSRAAAEKAWPWATEKIAFEGNTRHTATISNVRAWIGTERVTVNGAENSSTITAYIYGRLFESTFSTSDSFTVGDGSESTLERFAADGYLTFDVEGTKNNTIHFTNLTVTK